MVMTIAFVVGEPILVNCKIKNNAAKGGPTSNHERYLPHFILLFSNIIPAVGTHKISKILVTSNTVPTSASGSLAKSVKNAAKKNTSIFTIAEIQKTVNR